MTGLAVFILAVTIDTVRLALGLPLKADPGW